MNRVPEVIDAIRAQDSVRLRELAGYYSDTAAVSQEADILRMAEISYCMHKIFIKLHLREKTRDIISKCIGYLEKRQLEKALEAISRFDLEHGLFEGTLVEKSRIKIASRLHSRGISITQSASLTGAPVSELLDYVGETKGYAQKEEKSVEERLNIARDIFSGNGGENGG
jgi:hypothetical protein